MKILTINELLEGKKLEYAQLAPATFQKAQRKAKEGVQPQNSFTWLRTEDE